MARRSRNIPEPREQGALQELEREIHELRRANEAMRQAFIEERNRLQAGLALAADQRGTRQWSLGPFVGQSAALTKVLNDIDLLQRATNTPVLIHGESGTGKELVARAIHAGSDRMEGPFVPVNCATIPRELADSLLFGHVKGAFTGADRDQTGYFELAHEGTLFLDEVGTMPLEHQAKLLRVLEDRQVMPLGARAARPVDVRVLAATNADLREQIKAHSFRQDLYYRLAVFTVEVPALRRRREDIGLLARHFLQVYALEMGIPSPAISPEALAALEQHDFPGNIRELKNIIERALIESRHGQIRPEHLRLPVTTDHPPGPAPALAPESLPLELDQALVQTEIALIRRALAQTGENVAAAARLLGTHRSRIYRTLGKPAESA